MPVSVTMPRLGESVTEGTVTRWLKQEGERVEADEPLLEVSTDKVDTEIPSPAAGVLTRIVVAEDETVDVGTELAVIDGGDGASAPADGGGQETAAQTPEQQGNGRVQDEAAADTVAEAPSEEQAPAEEQATAPVAEQAPSGGDTGPGTPITMPALGESVTEGTVTRWLKQVGDSVEVDEPLLEVSTDKVDTEIPSPVAGTLVEIVVAEDETVPVGAQLAVIGGAGSGGASAPAEAEPAQAEPAQAGSAQGGSAQAESAQAEPAQAAPQQEATPAPQAEAAPAQAEPAPTQAAPSPQQTPAAPAQPAAAVTTRSEEDSSAYVTPLVRKLASEHGIDLGSVQGTGVGGRIRKQDILDAAAAKTAAAEAEAEARSQRSAAAEVPAAPTPVAAAGTAVESAAAPLAAASSSTRTTPVTVSPAAAALRGKTEKLSRLRKVIATRMVESLQTSAQLTTVVEVDVTRIARLRQQAKADFEARHGVKLSFLPFFALAAVEALQAHPTVNSSLDMEAGTVTYNEAEHLGIAVDTERGLLVPVIHDAGDLNLAGMARRIGDLAARTRENKVSPDELGGGTFTLTNTGSRGALFDTPIINQPQSAILGTGAVVKRAVVIDDPDLGELITPRSMVYLALSYDHRIVDGADAARFLATMKERLEGGAFEGELGLA
ncbi:MAG TPA: 2-oxo acid dehydrogenase subunit E2 [Mycobacteriales bacterium]|nr:2-oxo acid dehydrogenase subunit E2 [Mycobacteriales bacterium]